MLTLSLQLNPFISLLHVNVSMGNLARTLHIRYKVISTPPPLWFSFLAGKILIIVEKNVVFGLFVNVFSSILL